MKVGKRKYDPEKIIGLYLSGETIKRIGAVTGCSKRRIIKIVSDAKVEMRQRSGNLVNQTKISEEDVIEVYRLRFEQLWELNQIAARFNITDGQVSAICLGTTRKKVYNAHILRFKKP